MNHFYGIRIAQSFSSAERWYEINAYGCRLLARWSLLITLTGLLGFVLASHFLFLYTSVAIAVVLISVFVPLFRIIRWARLTGKT